MEIKTSQANVALKADLRNNNVLLLSKSGQLITWRISPIRRHMTLKWRKQKLKYTPIRAGPVNYRTRLKALKIRIRKRRTTIRTTSRNTSIAAVNKNNSLSRYYRHCSGQMHLSASWCLGRKEEDDH